MLISGKDDPVGDMGRGVERLAKYYKGIDVKNGQYLLYLDRCITDEETKKLIKFYGLEKDLYILSRDEHYSCDKCCRIS